MGKIIKVGRSVPHQLTDRQQENRKLVCEMLLARYKRKSYLHRIVTGDEKWIYFENPKRNRSYVDPGKSSKSTARPNRFGQWEELVHPPYCPDISPCDFDLILKVTEPISGRRFATREDIADAVRQQVTQFTHGAANAEVEGIQCLPHRWQRGVTTAGDYIEDL
ncbi:mariner Mos1 transposase [Trichonephila clavipes]|nr:mariner Mos1 transposase [Trichonephila clavipes]